MVCGSSSNDCDLIDITFEIYDGNDCQTADLEYSRTNTFISTIDCTKMIGVDTDEWFKLEVDIDNGYFNRNWDDSSCTESEGNSTWLVDECHNEEDEDISIMYVFSDGSGSGSDSGSSSAVLVTPVYGTFYLSVVILAGMLLFV